MLWILKGGVFLEKIPFLKFWFSKSIYLFFCSISEKKWAKNQKYERNIWLQCNFDKNSIRKLQLLENISSKSSKKLIFKGDVIEIKFHNSYKKSILRNFSENPLFEGGVFLEKFSKIVIWRGGILRRGGILSEYPWW